MSQIVSRNYCFTSFHKEPPKLKDGEDRVRYFCYQKEVCPETGKEHWQGYAEFYGPMKIPGAQKCFENLEKVHCEPRRGNRDQARDYCKKKETGVPGTFYEEGLWNAGGAGKRNDIKEACDILKEEGLEKLMEKKPEIILKYPRGVEKLASSLMESKVTKERDIKVLVWYGETGTGKSERCWNITDDWKDIYSKPDGEWWNGYKGQKYVLLDDFYGDMKPGFFLKVTDKYPIMVPTKGGFVPLLCEYILITSNVHPSNWWSKANLPESVKAAIARRITKCVHVKEDEETDISHEFTQFRKKKPKIIIKN